MLRARLTFKGSRLQETKSAHCRAGFATRGFWFPGKYKLWRYAIVLVACSAVENCTMAQGLFCSFPHTFRPTTSPNNDIRDITW